MHIFLNPSVESPFSNILNSKSKAHNFQRENLSKHITSTDIGSTTLSFLSAYLVERLGHPEFKTLLTSSTVHFAKANFFSVPNHPTGRTCGISTSKSFFWKLEIWLSAKVFCNHASGMVSTSSTKVFFQEACAQYRTLAAQQN
jgi:hypothetical protein